MNNNSLTSAATSPITMAGTSRRFVLIMLITVMAFSFIDRQVISVLLESIKDEFALSDSSLGLLSGAAFGVFYSICGLPIALLAERTNRRNVISASIAFWSLMTAASGIAGSFVQLAMTRAGVAVGEAGSSPAAHSMIADLYEPHERPAALGNMNSGINIGIMLGILLGGLLNHYYGWRITFIVVGLPGAVFSLIFLVTVREPARKLMSGTSSMAKPAIGKVIRFLWSIRTMRRAYLAHIGVTLLAFGVMQWLPSFLIRSFGMSLAEVGTTLALVLGGGGAFSASIGGFLTTRLLRRNVAWYRWLPAITTLLSAGFLFFALNAQDRTGLYIGLTAWALTHFLYLASDHSLIHHFVPGGYRAIAIGLLLLLMNLISYALGPQVVGLLSDFLSATWGRESLRHALQWYCLVAVIPVAIYWDSAKYVSVDLDAQSEHLIQGEK